MTDQQTDKRPDWRRPGEDYVTHTVEDAARYERERAEAAGEWYDDLPTPDEVA